MSAKTTEELRLERRREPSECDLIEIACLWPKKGENLGTLARTADALGACMVLPFGAKASRAIQRGNTIGVHNTNIHWIINPVAYLMGIHALGCRIVGVELAHNSIALRDLSPAVAKTVLVLGHETGGIPDEVFDYLTEVVEITMGGVGNSLNVAVAGSLVAYKLAGLI